MTQITETIPTLGTPPSTADPATFDSRGDDFLGDLPGFGTSLNLFGSQANTLASEVNSASVIVESGNNFMGAWSGLTGAVVLPYSVSHGGETYRALQAFADVTDYEPGVTSGWAAYWELVPSIVQTDKIVTLLQSTTASGASSVDLDTSAAASYDYIEVFVDNLVMSASTQFRARTSEDGVTFDSGASDYAFENADSGTNTNDSAATEIELFRVAITLGVLQQHRFRVMSAGDDSVYTQLVGGGARNNTYPSPTTHSSFRLANEVVDAIRLFPSTGTFSADIKVMGVKIS